MLTINGAKLMQHERERGSLEVGKYADMVVLSDNLFDLVKAGGQEKINEVKVLKTVFEGEKSRLLQGKSIIGSDFEGMVVVNDSKVLEDVCPGQPIRNVVLD